MKKKLMNFNQAHVLEVAFLLIKLMGLSANVHMLNGLDQHVPIVSMLVLDFSSNAGKLCSVR